jgi:hypothetical protein
MNLLNPLIGVGMAVMFLNLCASFVISFQIKHLLKTKYPEIYKNIMSPDSSIGRSLATSKLTRHPPPDIIFPPLLWRCKIARILGQVQTVILILIVLCEAFGSRLHW